MPSVTFGERNQIHSFPERIRNCRVLCNVGKIVFDCDDIYGTLAGRATIGICLPPWQSIFSIRKFGFRVAYCLVWGPRSTCVARTLQDTNPVLELHTIKELPFFSFRIPVIMIANFEMRWAIWGLRSGVFWGPPPHKTFRKKQTNKKHGGY